MFLIIMFYLCYLKKSSIMKFNFKSLLKVSPIHLRAHLFYCLQLHLHLLRKRLFASKILSNYHGVLAWSLSLFL